MNASQIISVLLVFLALSVTGDAKRRKRIGAALTEVPGPSLVLRASSQVPASKLSRKLTINEIDYYVNTDKGKAILEEEFDGIKAGKRRPWTIGELPENLEKNRYNSVIAYDETRVVLETLPEDPYSDYINANYIDGINSKREYVATQGPLPNTIDDFWRMVWQLNSTKIIMLANLVEHGERKVEQYWPEEADKYGNITVTLISQYEFPKLQHVVRTFFVEKDGEDTPRTIRHFHFTGWPDLGVPSDTLSIIGLLRQARKYKPDCKIPIVVHCSAGVGRTGTVILTDSMMQRAIAKGIVNFPARLNRMRVQRVDTVEKKEQYIFAHQAVYDFFVGNETENYLRYVDEEYTKIDDKSITACDLKRSMENNHRFPTG